MIYSPLFKVIISRSKKLDIVLVRLLLLLGLLDLDLLVLVVFSQLIVITSDSILFNIGIIFLTMEDVDKDCTSNSCTANTEIHPSQLGIFGNWDESEGQKGCDAVGEKVESHDDRFHRLRSLLVRIFETSNVGKDFRDGNKDVGWNLVSGREPVLMTIGVVIVGRCRVNLGLNTSGKAPKKDSVRILCCMTKKFRKILHCDGSEKEPNRNTQDRAEWDLEPTKGRVDDMSEDRDKNEEGERIDVLNDIVRYITSEHLQITFVSVCCCT